MVHLSGADQGERTPGTIDTCFDITFKKNGKKVWKKIGWSSFGVTAKYASQVRADRIHAILHGEDFPDEKPEPPLFQDLAQKYLELSKANKNRHGIEDKSRYENHLKDRFSASGLIKFRRSILKR